NPLGLAYILYARDGVRVSREAPEEPRVSPVRARPLTWQLGLESPPSALTVGEPWTLRLRLSHEARPGLVPRWEPLNLPAHALEAAALQLEGARARRLPVAAGPAGGRQLSVRLIPLAGGTQTIRILASPGGQASGSPPAELTHRVSVAPPVALPDIRELIDRRA